MSLCRSLRTVPMLLAAALFVPAASAGPEPPTPGDPVAHLRSLLLQPGAPDAEKRKKDMEGIVNLLSTAELAEALTLDAWDAGAAPALAPQEYAGYGVNQEVRGLVIDRLVQNARKALSSGDPGVRAAAASLAGATAVAERARRGYGGFNPRAVLPGASGGPFAGLAPDLVKRMKDKDEDAPVRIAAVRALVAVEPDPKLAADALADVLGGGKEEPSVRRAVAAGLGDLLAATAEKQARSLGRDLDVQVRLLQLANQAVPVAAHGLADDDLEVRRQCGRMLREVVTGWQGLLDNGAGRDFVVEPGFPPPPAPAQAAEIKKLLQALPDALNQALPALTKQLEDKPEAAVGAAEVLEAAAEMRRRIMKDALADPLPALLKARKSLADRLSDKEVRVRLAAVYVLEELGPEAAPAAGALADALTKDADPFVRWGAARALGKMAPNQPGDAVPSLARALVDKNDDVRLTAAISLARFGPAAKGAVADLAATVKRDDGARLAALMALAAVGMEAAPAAGEAAAALADADAEVRVAAAHALAHMGPLDDEPRKALRNALNDADADVRGAAAAALLSGK